MPSPLPPSGASHRMRVFHGSPLPSCRGSRTTPRCLLSAAHPCALHYTLSSVVRCHPSTRCCRSSTCASHRSFFHSQVSPLHVRVLHAPIFSSGFYSSSVASVRSVPVVTKPNASIDSEKKCSSRTSNYRISLIFWKSGIFSLLFWNTVVRKMELWGPPLEFLRNVRYGSHFLQ